MEIAGEPILKPFPEPGRINSNEALTKVRRPTPAFPPRGDVETERRTGEHATEDLHEGG
jgi:hypothetical protein